MAAGGVDDSSRSYTTSRLPSSLFTIPSRSLRMQNMGFQGSGMCLLYYGGSCRCATSQPTSRVLMLHHPRLLCANSWAATAALHRDLRAARVHDVKWPSQQAGVEQGRGFNPRGSTNRCLGFWTRCCAKSRRRPGATMSRNPGHVISAGMGACEPVLGRFAKGCGPNRLAALSKFL
jgi:hypothetical protein